MGLQSWPPNTSMACLDVETPSICRGKFKSVLQLCLQHRRSREQLVEQGIMPPLKTPAAFHEKICSLERARTGNFLKHKLCSRPERTELVRMHILQETQAEPSLQATQMKLKRARLADDLNEKLSQRPGPLELVEKNILPVGSRVSGVTNGVTRTPDVSDVYNFDEDNSDASSSPNPCSKEEPGCSSPSAQESQAAPVTVLKVQTRSQHSPQPSVQLSSNFLNAASTFEQQSNPPNTAPQPVNPAEAGVTSGPVLIKQSSVKPPADKNRSKKSKEPKPRVKKLKYHQYVPPDQKQEPSEVQMDSAYARLLQQQQQFLQLQILSQQQQQYNYQAAQPITVQSISEVQTSCSIVTVTGDAASTHVHLQQPQANSKFQRLPANLDEMKVAELKMELKLRSLPVSGTKTDLIERLKLYQEKSNIQPTAVPMETSESTKLTPPVSPIAAKVSSMSSEESNGAGSPAKLPSDSPSHATSSINPQHEGCAGVRKSPKKDSDKDKRLHEKERQIEELMKKLEQEQRLVEELRMQLEVEKRSQQSSSPFHLPPGVSVKVKEEDKTVCEHSAPCSSTGLPVLVKQEMSPHQSLTDQTNQFITGHQIISQPAAQILVPTSVPVSTVPLQLPSNSIGLQTAVSRSPSGLTETSAGLHQPCSFQSLPLKKSPSSSQSSLIVPQPEVRRPVSKCKDPPPYEDAVKQICGALTQGPTAASQHMDDLFDVLIESGEISPLIEQDPSGMDTPHPVTASVTTLPINTVLSRPPAVVQVAHLPTSLSSESQLEALQDRTSAPEPRTLERVEELHLPEIPMEVELHENASPSGLNLNNMDWLDLTLCVPAEGANAMDVAMPVGVFASDFLDSHELHLNWD